MTPEGLYTAEDLLAGFDPVDPSSYVKTWDFLRYQEFVREGGPTPVSLQARRRQAMVDAEIGDGLRRYLAAHDRIVGVMGGHSLRRNDPAYTLLADLARRLTLEGLLVTTGGGPGAMEAAHVGAFLAFAPEESYRAALADLAQQPALPDFRGLLAPDGSVAPGTEGLVAQAHAWTQAALQAKARLLDIPPGESLAIPTWRYGEEPTVPFATAYAKFCGNSLREEALVTEARAGIIYARGGGGTLREVFEDLEQNYYSGDAASITPMIFFDAEGFWQRDATFDAAGAVTVKGIRLDQIVPNALRYAWPANLRPAGLQKILFTTDFDAIVQALLTHAPLATVNLKLMLQGGAAFMPAARWIR